MSTANKLLYLGETKSKIKDVANMTGAGIDNQTTFRNYAQALYEGYINVLKDRDTLLDNMPKLTSTGSISGAANLPIYEDKMSKLSTQETTQGNQLFNFNTSNYLTYGSVNVSGKADDFTIEGVGTYDLRTYCVGLINYNTLYKYMTSEYAYLSISVYITDNETYSTWVDYANARTQITNNWNTNSLDLSNYQGKYLWIQLRGGNGTTYSSVNYKNFILSKTSVSSYEEYTGGTASPNPDYPQEVKTVKTSITINITDGTNTKTETIPLGDNEVCGIGDYKDELIVDKNGHCWLNKKIGKVVLNGNETVQPVPTNTSNYNRFYITITNITIISNDANDKSGLLCDKLVETTRNQNYAKVQGICYVGASEGNRLSVYTDTTKEMTSAQFKEWLSNNNLIVYPILATPELIDLNYTVDLTLYEGTNTITNSENMDMAIKYVKNVYE